MKRMSESKAPKGHNSTEREDQAKKAKPWEDYLCALSFKTKPVNEAFLDKFALDWVEAARKDTKYINIWSYPVTTAGLFEDTVFKWMERNENVKSAHAYVKSLCKVRRDIGAAFRELDSSWIARTMPLYGNEYKDLEEWRNKLREKVEGANSGPQIVVIEKYPESDKVPKKKE